MSAREVGGGVVNLPTPRWALDLLIPVTQEFDEIDTVVEALLPHPVNLNTSSEEVLTAVVENVRQGKRRQPHGQTSRGFSRSEAANVASELAALRGDPDRQEQLLEGPYATAEVRPFESFQDLAERYFEPKMANLEQNDRARWMRLYRALLSGARVLTTLLHALIDRDLQRGMASLCLGGGNAVAMAVERS